MKKFLSLCAVLSLFCVDKLISYDDIGYMTLKYGLTDIEDNFSFDQNSFGADFTGDIGYQVKPKLDFTYVSIDKVGGVDYLFQTSVNAFYKSQYGYQNIIPYFYGGLGYEYVSGARKDFDNNFYIQEAIGVEIPISQPVDELHIVTELRLMQLIGSTDGQDSEAAIFIGLRLPIGRTFTSYSGVSGGTTTTASRKLSRSYAELSDEDIPNPELVNKDIFDETTTTDTSTVTDSEVMHEPTALGKNVRSYHDLQVDSDGDGVPNDLDVCPGTPDNVAVNQSGCPIRDRKIYIDKSKVHTTTNVAKNFKILPMKRKRLDIHFKLNSDEITTDSRKVIRDFVAYINSKPFNKVIIEGYTDGTGIFEKNLELSKRRAQAVKELMIQYGVDSDKITAIGKGSLSPIASDETEEGRALNRRIEITVE